MQCFLHCRVVRPRQSASGEICKRFLTREGVKGIDAFGGDSGSPFDMWKSCLISVNRRTEQPPSHRDSLSADVAAKSISRLFCSSRRTRRWRQTRRVCKVSSESTSCPKSPECVREETRTSHRFLRHRASVWQTWCGPCGLACLPKLFSTKHRYAADVRKYSPSVKSHSYHCGNMKLTTEFDYDYKYL